MQETQTWIGGPQHEVRRQHIPGYCGHIAHLSAENQFSKSFATITNNCFENIEKDANTDRFQTMNHLEFGKPNRLQSIGTQIVTQKETLYTPIDKVPVVGYQGFRPVFRNPIKQVIQPQITERQQIQPARDVIPVVGYTGYIPKIKAQNLYAKCYNDHCKQSIFY